MEIEYLDVLPIRNLVSIHALLVCTAAKEQVAIDFFVNIDFGLLKGKCPVLHTKVNKG
jgi:hypothetical protein